MRRAPAGFCQICWERNVAAPEGGATCPHGGRRACPVEVTGEDDACLTVRALPGTEQKDAEVWCEKHAKESRKPVALETLTGRRFFDCAVQQELF